MLSLREGVQGRTVSFWPGTNRSPREGVALKRGEGRENAEAGGATEGVQQAGNRGVCQWDAGVGGASVCIRLLAHSAFPRLLLQGVLAGVPSA